MTHLSESLEQKIAGYSNTINERAHQGTQLCFDMTDETGHVEHVLDLKDSTMLVNVVAEFVFYLLYFTDCRLSVSVEQTRRFQIMDYLLRSCIDLIVQEHIPHWPEQDKHDVSEKLLDTYAQRAELYAEGDRIHAEGNDSVESNIVYVFGKVVAKLSGVEQNLEFIVRAASVVDFLIRGRGTYEGLPLESFVRSAEKD
jgi:hypothetical protein